MKKFLAIFCVICILFAGTYAFAAASPYTYTGVANFVVSENNRLVGIKNATEMLNEFPVYASNAATIDGVRDNRVIREKGLARFYAINDVTVGLTALNVTIVLDSRYYPLVKTVIGVEELDVANIIAATYYVSGNYIGHLFFDNATHTIKVGVINFKNKAIDLYLGDYNNDNILELGFGATQPVYEPTSSEEFYSELR